MRMSIGIDCSLRMPIDTWSILTSWRILRTFIKWGTPRQRVWRVDERRRFYQAMIVRTRWIIKRTTKELTDQWQRWMGREESLWKRSEGRDLWARIHREPIEKDDLLWGTTSLEWKSRRTKRILSLRDPMTPMSRIHWTMATPQSQERS
jgi:hypothetical protein